VAICFAEESESITIPKLIYGSAADELTLAHEVFSVLRKVDDSVRLRCLFMPLKKRVWVWRFITV